MSEKNAKKSFEEVNIIKKLDHPNIIKFHEAFLSNSPQKTINLIVEYADGGDLSQKINEMRKLNKQFEESEILDYFIQICLALYHMHKKHILHRDLKSQNVFLTKTGMIKLGDFGLSKSLDFTLAKARSILGTPYYLSPELIQNIPYSYKSDIWALGVLLYEMTTLKMPFDAPNLPMLAFKIQKGEYQKLNDRWSTDLKQLIYSLLNVNPDKRPEIKDIIS